MLVLPPKFAERGLPDPATNFGVHPDPHRLPPPGSVVACNEIQHVEKNYIRVDVKYYVIPTEI